MNQSKDVLTGSVIVTLGLLLFVATLGVKDFAAVGVGATFLPRIAAGLFVFLGAVMLIAALRSTPTKPGRTRSTTETTEKPAKVFGGIGAVLLSFVLMSLYVGLMDKLGFILTSTAYIFVQTLILTKGAPRQYLRFGLLALLTSVGVYYLFVKAFQVMIPAGILG